MREVEQGSAISRMPDMNAEGLRVRLDTGQEIQEIDLFLRGKVIKTYIDEESGAQVSEIEDSGAPLCNDKGRQMILMWVRMHVNKVTIMGNTEKDSFQGFIGDIYESFTDNVVLNCRNWNINDGDLLMIITGVMNLLELALSRTIDNKERESLTTSESNVVKKTTQTKGLHIGGEK